MSDNETKSKKTKETEFFMFYGDQLTSGDIVISAGTPKLNPGTGKLELDDATVKKVVFENGIYNTSDEFEIEFLNTYNKGGELSNGNTLKPTAFPTISTKSPNKSSVEIKEVIKEVIKNVIPASFLETMDEATIADIAKNSFQYEVKAEKKKDMIKELTKEGFVV